MPPRPPFAPLLTLDTPRNDLPVISTPPVSGFIAASLARPLNDLQKSLVSGTARRAGLDPQATLGPMLTRQHAPGFFESLPGGNPRRGASGQSRKRGRSGKSAAPRLDTALRLHSTAMPL